MKTIASDRRQFLKASALLSGVAMFPSCALAVRPPIKDLPVRTTGKVDVLYKTPHYGANGLWMSDEGMWIIHQIDNNYASLIDLSNGRLIREVECEGVDKASGICIDENNVMWIGSTYNRLIIACDPKTGKAIAKYSTPGAGQIYPMKGDVKGHRTPLQPAYPPPPPSGPSGRIGAGKLPLSVNEGPVGTGPHCILPKGDLLYVDVPPARSVFAIDKESWVVQDRFLTAGDRPHDMSWANPDRTQLWCADSNYNAFFLHDVASGELLQRVNLPEGSPIIHGAKLHNGYMYMCDDVGWMSRVRFDV